MSIVASTSRLSISRSSRHQIAAGGHVQRRRRTYAAVLMALVGFIAFSGRADAAIETRLDGLTRADAAYASADDAALAIAASPVASSDIATDSLAGSGIACIIVTLAALASDGGDRKKDRKRTRTDE